MFDSDGCNAQGMEGRGGGGGRCMFFPCRVGARRMGSTKCDTSYPADIDVDASSFWSRSSTYT